MLLVCVTTLVSLPVAAGPIEDAEPRAVQILLDSARSEDPLLRSHAIEAAKAMPDRALPMVTLALDDENPGVRYAALATAGRLQLEALGPQAATMARDITQPDYVKAAALFAAARCGEEVDLGRLAAMLWDDNIGTRSNAAMLFGWMEDPQVIPVLLDASEAPMDRARPIERELVRLQITESLLNLGHDDSLKALRGAAYSSHDEVRILATLMLGKALDRGMEGNLIGFLAKNPIELRLAAAESLARMGSLEGLPVIFEAAQHPVATVRSQAAFALAQADSDPEAVGQLVGLMDDPNDRVRISAAAAILESLHR
ncbi:HEAT repeat protein [Algisphaera agarilytica]|uniref:HEAT repeat protein n=2 Tax=Algisphaera agarilytica TaxID=1385975 RepID=A0A7X0H8V7_9BACT|nr:HEAT repeat protein [Algisphaera agarilytica]